MFESVVGPLVGLLTAKNAGILVGTHIILAWALGNDHTAYDQTTGNRIEKGFVKILQKYWRGLEMFATGIGWILKNLILGTLLYLGRQLRALGAWVRRYIENNTEVIIHIGR